MPRTVLDDFDAQVRRAPEATAVVTAERQVSYRDLDARANALASRLIDLGARPGDTVGLCVERSVDMAVGILGTLKAGTAYVPLDPRYPHARLAFMLQDVRPRFVLVQSRTRKRIADIPDGPAPRLVEMDSDEALDPSEWSPLPREEVSPDALAYIMFTSGSSGKPKGVAVSHRNLLHSTRSRMEYYPTEVEAFLLLSSFSFDSSVAGIFWSLCQGGRLCLPRSGEERDAGTVVELIERLEISHFLTLPSVYAMLLERLRASAVPRLQTVIVAGESCPRVVVEKHEARLPDVSLYNEYGPTEATVWSTAAKLTAATCRASVPIGKPPAGTRIHILDRHRKEVPDGEEGEIAIGGDGVAIGYWNREESTAERFVPLPSNPTSRIYLTGDLGRIRPDGNLEFLGRRDRQVKLRGFRIELGEIETALRRHRSISDAAVTLRSGASGEPRLVAYVVAPDATPPVEELRRYLGEVLPEFMIPAAYVMLAELPLTPNGKLDHDALPPPTSSRPTLEQPFVAPRDSLESFLVERWREALELDRVGVHDRFFELGGSSLQAARLINGLQQELGESIFVVTIFDAPSIAEYARLLREQYAEAVERRFGSRPANDVGPKRERGAEVIDEDAVERFRSSIPTLEGFGTAATSPKLKPALFILAPPRSGTTLLRVMMAGHPNIFAADELQLLHFHTLRDRHEAYADRFSLWLEGAVRAVMELRSCDADTAKRLIAGLEDDGQDVKALYRAIQEWIGDRMLVDKSPSYGLDPNALKKAEADFERPLYVHLVRHPYAMIRSFERLHMDQVLYLRKNDFSARQLGELVWLLTHRNVLDFLGTIPEERYVRLRYEDLVRDPEARMRALCERFGLRFHPGLVDPYAEIEHKMTDGIYPESLPMGDVHLLEHRAIDPRLADTWKGVAEDDFLSPITWELAESLGYERPAPAPAAPAASRGQRLRRIRSVRR